MAIYEMHLGSWMRVGGGENRFDKDRDLAAPLAKYLQRMKFTHVQFTPLMQHPFSGSWRYQTNSCCFAPTSRYGTPQDLMYRLDHLHQQGTGVLLDRVPSHFPSDEHGLADFDGTHLHEHSAPRKGSHPEWNRHTLNSDRSRAGRGVPGEGDSPIFAAE